MKPKRPRHGSSHQTQRHRAAALARSWPILTAGVFVASSGCGFDLDDAERTFTQRHGLTGIGPNVLVTPSPNANWGNETSATSVPSGNPTHLFVSYNSNPGVDRPDGGTRTRCGRSYSSDGGATWTSDEDYNNPLPGYGSLGGGWSYWFCRGDTYSTALGKQSATGGAADPRVVMVAVTDNKKGGQPPNPPSLDVAMWTSIDRGATFTNVLRVSHFNPPGNGADGPKVAADPTNETAWVYWWGGSGTGNGNFLRPVQIDAQGQMTPGATVDITGKLASPTTISHPSMAIKPAASPGDRPTIYLAYPSPGGWPGQVCDDPSEWKTSKVTWWLSESSDGGHNWSTIEVDTDETWPHCLSATIRGGNRPYISIAYDEVEDKLMLAYSRSMRDEDEKYVGTRVVTKRYDPQAGTFVTWIPICNPALCPVGVPGDCLVNGAPPAGETFCHQFGQAVTVRSGSGGYRYAAVYHDTRDSSLPHPSVGDEVNVRPLESLVRGYSGRTGLPLEVWYTDARLTPLGPGVPWEEKAINGNLWWGDYEAGAVDLGEKFYGIWADNRDGTTTAKLRGAYFNE